jgi:hypothetical protein
VLHPSHDDEPDLLELLLFRHCVARPRPFRSGC